MDPQNIFTQGDKSPFIRALGGGGGGERRYFQSEAIFRYTYEYIVIPKILNILSNSEEQIIININVTAWLKIRSHLSFFQKPSINRFYFLKSLCHKIFCRTHPQCCILPGLPTAQFTGFYSTLNKEIQCFLQLFTLLISLLFYCPSPCSINYFLQHFTLLY